MQNNKEKGSDEERWDPAAVFKPGVPADMIHMQVRAHNEINRFRRHPHPGQFIEKGSVFHVPCRGIGTVLVVTDAGFD